MTIMDCVRCLYTGGAARLCDRSQERWRYKCTWCCCYLCCYAPNLALGLLETAVLGLCCFQLCPVVAKNDEQDVIYGCAQCYRPCAKWHRQDLGAKIAEELLAEATCGVSTLCADLKKSRRFRGPTFQRMDRAELEEQRKKERKDTETAARENIPAPEGDKRL
eukprot:scaffold8063_cov277-Pinguiococcus_pyrenoidosus.AAC.1